MSAEVQVIDKLTARNMKVRSVFDRDYAKDNPPPDVDNQLIKFGVPIGLGASLTLSALLTIPAFMRVLGVTGMSSWLQVIGGSAGFLAVDFFLFVGTFYLISSRWQLSNKNDLTQQTVTQVQQIMLFASVFGFVVSIASNLYFVFVGYEIVTIGGDGYIILSRVVGVLLALAPAVQSVTTGSVFALMPLTREVAMTSWRNEREEYWKQVRKRHYGYQDLSDAVERLSTPETDNVDMSAMSMSIRQTTDRQQTRVYSAVDKALEYLQDNPDAVNLTVRELGDVAGVGKDSAAKARKEFMAQ